MNQRKAFFTVLAAAAIGGGVPVFSKTGLKVIPPYTFTFLRFFLASLILLPFFLRSAPKWTKSTWHVIGLSLLATGNVTFFTLGIRLTTATVGQILYVTVPLIATVLSYFFLKERVTTKKAVGIAMGLLGAFIIIVLPLIKAGTGIHGSFAGNTLILIAVLSFSCYSVFSKRYHKTYTPFQLTTIFSLTTAVALAPIALTEYLKNPRWIHALSAGPLFSVLYVAIGGGMVYYTLYQYSIKHGSPTIASMTLLIQPVAAYGWASVVLGEKLTPEIIIGALLALAGAYLVIMKKEPDMQKANSKSPP